MQSRMIRPLLAAGAALALCAGARAADKPVATVNGTRITHDELVAELLVRHGETVLEDMIRERVVEQAVASRKLQVSNAEVNTEIERERRSFAAKGKNLEDMIDEKYQMSMAGYRSIVRRWLLIRKLILGDEHPSNAEVMMWFYENRERRYDTPAEYMVRHIFIALKDPRTGTERTQIEVQRRVEAVRNGVLRGKKFAVLAARYSDDLITHDKEGRPITPRPRIELGPIDVRAARVHLEPNFVEAMTRLKPGQSGMVNTPQGYHFIKVTGKKEGREARYEEFRRIAREDYLEERALMQREIFLRGLMERARIERNFVPPKRGEGAHGRSVMSDTDDSRRDEEESTQ